MNEKTLISKAEVKNKKNYKMLRGVCRIIDIWD